MATKKMMNAKVKAKGTRGSAARPRTRKATERKSDGAAAGAGAGAEASTRDSRIPPPGTVIRKLDRYGAVRCECKVVADGIDYAGTVYPSLSAAAMAAAKDLHLTNKTQNGFAFWGLSRPADLLTALEHAWGRYQTKATALLKRVTDDNRPTVGDALRGHAETLEQLVGELS